MSRCLVTGGAGFIGSHVATKLVESGNEVVILDDLSGGCVENLPANADFVKGSILDHQLVEDVFNEYKPEYVYHLAAYAAEGLSHFIKRFNYNNNLLGSVNLINESIKNKVKCFVFTSSIAVYGKGQLPMREEMIPEPEDPYGVAKYAVEMELKCSKEMFDLDYIVFRPHNVYGENQNIGDRYRNVLGIFMNQLLQGKPLTIFGDGSQTRAFTYISDISEIIANSVNVPSAYNQVFNVGASKDYTVKHIAETIMKELKVEGEIRYLPERNEVKHAYSDHSKVEKFFGKQVHTDLMDGIRNMAAWVHKTGVRSTPRFSNIEITDKIPKIWLED